VVVMGVSGSGKTTQGRALAEALGTAFVDADDLHPAANIAKMAAGAPLSDADRAPWLEAVADRLKRLGADGGGVLACSALKRRYRARILEGAPSARLVYLKVSQDCARRRMAARTDHFMPASLAASQFDALEEPSADEDAFVVSGEDEALRTTRRLLGALTGAAPDPSAA
jgi:gluconokinase